MRNSDSSKAPTIGPSSQEMMSMQLTPKKIMTDDDGPASPRNRFSMTNVWLMFIVATTVALLTILLHHEHFKDLGLYSLEQWMEPMISRGYALTEEWSEYVQQLALSGEELLLALGMKQYKVLTTLEQQQILMEFQQIQDEMKYSHIMHLFTSSSTGSSSSHYTL